MSPHNKTYKNKATSASPRSIASKHSPPTPVSKSNSKSKPKSPPWSPPRSMSSSPSSSVSSSSSSSTSASGAPSKPKRPLSSYNLFFKFARDEMLASTASSGSTTYDHSKHATTLQSPGARRDLSKKGRPPPHRKIGFAEMARQIGAQWKALEDDRREHFEASARVDKQRYLREMEAWKAAGGDKQLQQKDKKETTRKQAATSKTTSNARKSPPGSPKSKKAKKKATVGASNVDMSTTQRGKEPEQHDVYSPEDYATYDNGFPPSSSLHLDQTSEIVGSNNTPRTVSARSSRSNSSAESLCDSWANAHHNSVGEPCMHYQQQQNRPYMPYHTDFQSPPAATTRTARRVSEANDDDDFLSETYGQYHSQQEHSYVTHRDNWQHQSGQPPHYPYQQIAPGDVAPSSLQVRHQIINNDVRNVSISSANSDPRAKKIAPSNWNTTMVGYPALRDPAATVPADFSHQSHQIWQFTETAPSSSGNDATASKSCDPKWSDIDDTDRLLDVLGQIDDEDVEFWAAANPMA